MTLSDKSWKLFVKIIAVHLILISLIFAGTTGKIAGTVVDQQNGEPLPGVNIYLLNTSYGAATDLEGYYYIINIPPGSYTLVAQMIGYKEYRIKEVSVSADRTTNINIRLSPETIEGEVIEVTAEKARVQKDLTSTEVSVDSRKIEALPVRSVTEIISLQAGIVKDANNQIHIRGGRSTEVSYMVDGVQILDPLNRSWGVSVDDQAIDELKTISGTFNAEYGQALSGVINIVTKKGSDRFKWNITGYFGDYFSLDDNVFYVMNNEKWAHAAARALVRSDKSIIFDFSKYGSDYQKIYKQKPYLTKKPYLRNYQPWKHQDIQLNLSGPIPLTDKRIKYFVSARYTNRPGYAFGKRYFMPWGFRTPAMDTLHTFKMPDNKLVPLSWDKNFSGQLKLFFKLSNSVEMNYGLYVNKNHNFSTAGYNYKYVPDAGKHYYTDVFTHILSLKQVLSPSTFYEFKGSLYKKSHKNYLYKDPFDYRYMPDKTSDFELYVFGRENANDISLTQNPNDFAYFGNPLDRGAEKVDYYSLKYDITSQVTKNHLIKAGASAVFYDLNNNWFTLQFSEDTYRPIIPSVNSPFHVNYNYQPREFAAYIQDKIEFKEFIVNLGIRYDYFNSNGNILADPKDPQIYDPFKFDHIYKNYAPGVPDSELVKYSIAERRKFWYKKSSPKSQISPRLGFSFPITEKGVIHFSYGHFFQNPEFRFLYDNPNFWVEGAGSQNLVGNSDLNAERSVMYEIGLQQELGDGLYVHVTGFYRDIRDWVGISPPIDTYRGITYFKYINKDNATAKGLTFSGTINYRHLNINLDYTYMVAKGTSSNPQDAYYDALDNRAPRLTLVYLNWDQTHSLNTVINYNNKGWNATLTGALASGFPYTPSFARGEVSGSGTFVGLTENSARKPLTLNFDLRLSKTINLPNDYNMTLYATITNLLDMRNARNVYTDTGQPDYTLQGVNQIDRQGDPDVEISKVQEYFANPYFYTPPRFIELGFSINR
ncbi:MAG: outer membrane beta-barrel protein [Calditrichaeota bacterium]|nr:outer membrane beta-barrel protein [Calditrichota bacterium]